MLNNDISYQSEIRIQQLHHGIRVFSLRQCRKPSYVYKENCSLQPRPLDPLIIWTGQNAFYDLWRDIATE